MEVESAQHLARSRLWSSWNWETDTISKNWICAKMRGYSANFPHTTLLIFLNPHLPSPSAGPLLNRLPVVSNFADELRCEGEPTTLILLVTWDKSEPRSPNKYQKLCINPFAKQVSQYFLSNALLSNIIPMRTTFCWEEIKRGESF